MGAPRHLYTFTDDLVKLKSSDMAEYRDEDDGSVYYTRRDSDNDSLALLLLDTTRNVTVNGKLFQTQDKLLDEGVRNERFDDFLKLNFEPKNIKRLKEHYSQRPMNIGALAFVDHFYHEKWKPRLPAKGNLYEKNGVVYMTVSIDSVSIVKNDQTKAELGTIEGPIEAQFVLTDKGFKLQSISTASMLLRDLYLGTVAEERILRACVIPEVEKDIKAQLYKVLDPYAREKSGKQSFKDALNDAMSLLQNYKANTISFEAVEAGFTKLINDLNENKLYSMGRRLSSLVVNQEPTTRDILNESLRKLRATAAMIPKAGQAPEIRPQ